jgi:hypothetical protein
MLHELISDDPLKNYSLTLNGCHMMIVHYLSAGVASKTETGFQMELMQEFSRLSEPSILCTFGTNLSFIS